MFLLESIYRGSRLGITEVTVSCSFSIDSKISPSIQAKGAGVGPLLASLRSPSWDWDIIRHLMTDPSQMSLQDLGKGSEEVLPGTLVQAASCWHSQCCRGAGCRRKGFSWCRHGGNGWCLLAEHPCRRAMAGWGDSSALLPAGCGDSGSYSALCYVPAGNSCCQQPAPTDNLSTVVKVTFYHTRLNTSCCLKLLQLFCVVSLQDHHKVVFLIFIYLQKFKSNPIASSSKLIQHQGTHTKKVCCQV